MMLGHVRDKFPRLTLSLPGRQGELSIEFIVDTGFEGQLALPQAVLRELEAVSLGNRPVAFADGATYPCQFFQIMLDWEEELRPVEIIVLEGKPLLGVELMEESLLQVEMTTGGQVSIEPL